MSSRRYANKWISFQQLPKNCQCASSGSVQTRVPHSVQMCVCMQRRSTASLCAHPLHIGHRVRHTQQATHHDIVVRVRSRWTQSNGPAHRGQLVRVRDRRAHTTTVHTSAVQTTASCCGACIHGSTFCHVFSIRSHVLRATAPPSNLLNCRDCNVNVLLSLNDILPPRTSCSPVM
jgi:hypothetical protein